MANRSRLLLLQFLLLLTLSATTAHEKKTHLRFFWHDVFTRPNATSVLVAAPPNATAANPFRTVLVIDNAMTRGLELTSQFAGRAQGFYVLVSQADEALLISMNLAFMKGKYKGSSLAILDRNPVNDTVREIPVVGSSGRFRLARSYALLKTYSFDVNMGNAVVEYNVYVTHS